VVSPLAGTPAYLAGVLAGDLILKINGEDTEGLTLQDAVVRLRGPVGEVVSLTVQHRGAKEPTTFDIERALIHVDTVLGDRRHADGAWAFFLPGEDKIAYVRVTAFSKDTVEELKSTLYRLQARGMRALILDLRNNPGGLLQAGTQTCDLFLKQGRIVSIRDRERRDQEVYDATGQGPYSELPLVLLVNRFSASASEIVSACLQDHGRAIVVGERSYGKGTVQSVINLEGGESVLKLTTASYWRPSGSNIHRTTDAKQEDVWGVSPSPGFEVKLTDAEFEALLRERRARDIIPSANGHEPESPSSHGASSSLDIDPQLRKAAEHARNLLSQPAVVPAAG
jgi:carboxyl-terminal processing protease